MLRRALLARVRAAGPTELSVMETGGNLVATANINALTGLPERPGDFAFMQATEQGEYAAAEPTADGGLQIRVIQLMPAAYPGAQRVSCRRSTLAARISRRSPGRSSRNTTDTRTSVTCGSP